MPWLAALTILAVSLSQACHLKALETPTVPNASKTPHFTFSDTLEAQLEELKTNSLLERFHASRAAKAADPHRPIYHHANVKWQQGSRSGPKDTRRRKPLSLRSADPGVRTYETDR